jgi:glyoxylase-like metal-dependent hydrolase (beta-lactamase superfamily II)
MDRRQFVQQALCAGAAPTISAWSHAAAAPRDKAGPLAVTPLGSGLSLISGAGGNVVVFDSPAGVLLVDGGSPERSGELLKQVRTLTGKAQVHTLFNTHWHWDQTGSNPVLGQAGTRIIAHENTRLWLSTDVDSKWEHRRYQRLPAKAQPNQTFYTTGVLEFGGEHIEYGQLGQAHTDGDIFVHLRHADVLVVGDVLSAGRYPVIDYCTGGWIGGMVTAAETLLARCTDGTKLIGGAGLVQGSEDLKSQHAMLADLKTKLSRLLAQGMSVQDMLDAKPTRDYDAKWGDPTLFIANAWPGLVYRARELGVSIV